MMKVEKSHILLLAEAHVNTNSQEIHDEYTFIFSTSVSDQQRADAEQKRKQNKTIEV